MPSSVFRNTKNLYIRGHHHLNEETSYRMKKKIFISKAPVRGLVARIYKKLRKPYSLINSKFV